MEAVIRADNGIPDFDSVPDKEMPVPDHPRQDILDAVVSLNYMSILRPHHESWGRVLNPLNEYVLLISVHQGGAMEQCWCEGYDPIEGGEHNTDCVWQSNIALKRLPGFIKVETSPREDTDLYYHYSLGKDTLDYQMGVAGIETAKRLNRYIEEKRFILENGLDIKTAWGKEVKHMFDRYHSIEERIKSARDIAEHSQTVLNDFEPAYRRIVEGTATSRDYKYIPFSNVRAVKEKVARYNKWDRDNNNRFDVVREAMDLPDDSLLKEILLREQEPVKHSDFRTCEDKSLDSTMMNKIANSMYTPPNIMFELEQEIYLLIKDLTDTVMSAKADVQAYESMESEYEWLAEELTVYKSES